MFSANSSQVSEDRLYVEDVFSTYLYTGNVSTRTITNDIDLAGKGGLVWIKARSAAGSDHNLFDTNRGATKRLFTNSATTETTTAGTLTSFQPTGFTLGSSSSTNASSTTYASWSFREAPKFFDVVTWSGNDVNGRSISHSLGVAPGTIIVKKVNAASSWVVYHRSLGSSSGYPNYMLLQTTDAQFNGISQVWNSAPTATSFSVGNASEVNESGGTYVAYLFAHDTTSDGIIQCGSFTTDGSANGSVNLGWEPQWVLVKPASNTGSWQLVDAMRGMTADKLASQVLPNTNTAEQSVSDLVGITSTGFTVGANGPGLNMTVIYIAIRRGPMRTPTSGTSVFSPASPTGSSLPTQIPTGFPVDLGIIRNRTFVDSAYFFDRLRGTTTTSIKYIKADSTAAEATGSGFGMGLDNNTGVTSNWYSSADPTISWNFRRAPSFFDEVCYTGTGVARTVNHNLGVAPELMIVKKRNDIGAWGVYVSSLGVDNYLTLQTSNSVQNGGSLYWNSTAPTATVFSVGTLGNVNGSGDTYVAYLFASCPGVSKVGSYTGNGSSQTINCGFAAGARFVMIKRTDSTGDWYVWDTARGIVSGNDPHLSLNSTAAEVTTDDSVDTDSSGFVVNQLSATNINVSSATYIYLAVA